MNGGHYNPHHDYVMKEKAPDHVSPKILIIFFWSVNLHVEDFIFPSDDLHFEDILFQLIYLPESSLYIGDRVATWMFYMSDVSMHINIFSHIL